MLYNYTVDMPSKTDHNTLMDNTRIKVITFSLKIRTETYHKKNDCDEKYLVKYIEHSKHRSTHTSII